MGWPHMTEFGLGALRGPPKAITLYKNVAARDILAANRGGLTRYICTAYRAARFQSGPPRVQERFHRPGKQAGALLSIAWHATPGHAGAKSVHVHQLVGVVLVLRCAHAAFM